MHVHCLILDVQRVFVLGTDNRHSTFLWINALDSLVQPTEQPVQDAEICFIIDFLLFYCSGDNVVKKSHVIHPRFEGTDVT